MVDFETHLGQASRRVLVACAHRRGLRLVGVTFWGLVHFRLFQILVGVTFCGLVPFRVRVRVRVRVIRFAGLANFSVFPVELPYCRKTFVGFTVCHHSI